MSRKQLKLGVPNSNAMATFRYNSSNGAPAVSRVRGRMSVSLSRERETSQALRPPQRERTMSSFRYRGKRGVEEWIMFLRQCTTGLFESRILNIRALLWHAGTRYSGTTTAVPVLGTRRYWYLFLLDNRLYSLLIVRVRVRTR